MCVGNKVPRRLRGRWPKNKLGWPWPILQVVEIFHMISVPFWIDSLAWLGLNRYRNAEIPSACSVKQAAKITYCGR